MTSGDRTAMGDRSLREFPPPLSSRPPLVSKFSNSVPSTPHQYPRDFTRRSRTPSPTGALGSHSPRSVVSEANGYLASLPRSRPVCKYETGAATSRRRIPYNIGDEPLPKEPMVKQSLEDDEQRRLEKDMAELFKKLEPSDESERRRQRLVVKLEDILHREWPGNKFKVHVFGSSGNLLCTSDSDVDICIQTPMKQLETMHMLADALSNSGMQRVICVASAKVPIVKMWDPELNLACDMNVNNTLALENTRMIKTYVQIDKRVRPLAMIIKYWTKQRILNDAGIGGTLSSYTWICMIINFLQTRNPPVLPVLHQLPHKEAMSADGIDSGFADNLEELQDKSTNTESLAELLFAFFRTHAHDLDYERAVISVRHGRLLTRKEKGWDGPAKEGQWRLCVEEPFNTSRNLGNSADSTAFRGIHLELRRAFDFLADNADLEGCCAAYEFPVEEKPSGWFRRPGPKAPLQPQMPTQSTRGGRGGMGGRGNRHNNSAKSQQGYRRASTSTFPSNFRSPYNNNSAYMNYSAADYNAASLEMLRQQFNMLALQQQDVLRSQGGQVPFYLHPSGVQGRGQMSLQGQNAIPASSLPWAQMYGQPMASVATSSMSNQTRTNSTPLPQGFFGPSSGLPSPRMGDVNGNPLQGYYTYGYPLEQSQPQTPSASHDGSRTNPSSPSLTQSTPAFRRQRTSTVNGVQSSSARSQSQPARPHSDVPQVPFMMPPPAADMSAGYQGEYLPMNGDMASIPTMEQFPPPGQGYMPESSGQSAPKGYVGWFLGGASQNATPYTNLQVAPIPPYSEIEQRRKRPSQDLVQPLLNSSRRRSSRSPSPLSQEPADMSGNAAGHNATSRTERASSENGFLIVNGSYPQTPAQSYQQEWLEDSSASNGPNGLGLGYDPIRWSDGNDGQLLSDSQIIHPPHPEAPGEGWMTVEEFPPPEWVQPEPKDNSTAPRSSQDPVVVASANVLRVTTTPPSEQRSPRISPSAQAANSEHNRPAVVETPIKNAPLLSPVREIVTPSPTATRSLFPPNESSTPSIATRPAVSAQVNGHPPLPPPPTPLPKSTAAATESKKASADSNDAQKSSSTAPAAPTHSQWQSAGKKKRRRRSKGGAEAKSGPMGEPMPTNEEERKGG